MTGVRRPGLYGPAAPAVLLIVALAFPGGAAAQVPADVWRSFAEKVDVGTEIRVRLTDGTRFRAVLVGTQPDGLLLQPKTRVPVPVQAIPYQTIASLERRGEPGVGAGKAAAIGVATGVGAFFAVMAIVFALVSD
jgi:hypothetical protein